MMVLALILFGSVPLQGHASAVAYSFALTTGQYAYQSYSWSESQSLAATLDVVVDVDSVNTDVVDAYVFDATNFATYQQFDPSEPPYYIFGREGVYEGSWTLTGEFTPAAGALYYVVIDNTCTWGTCPTSGASGSFELTTTAVQHLLSGFVYERIGSLCSSNGVPGALIALSPGSYTTTTDASGHYSLLVDDGTYTATISKSGYESASASVVLEGADVTRDFCIAREAASTHLVSGHVYREGTATGIAGAQLTYNAGEASATTDSSGAYSVALADGTYDVVIAAPGYESWTDAVTVSGSDLTRNYELRPEPAGTHEIRGYVYKEGTSEAIPGASVTATPGGHSATTDAAGFYSLEVPDGTYEISAVAAGYQPSRGTVTVSGGSVSLDFELAPSGTVAPSGDGAWILYGGVFGGIAAAAAVGFLVARRGLGRARPSGPRAAIPAEPASRHGEAPVPAPGATPPPAPHEPRASIRPTAAEGSPTQRASPAPAPQARPSGMIPCSRCGRILPSSAAFCGTCGARVQP